jgi:protein TonB
LAGSIQRGKNLTEHQPLVKIYPEQLATTFGVRLLDRKVTMAVRWLAVAAKEAKDIPAGLPRETPLDAQATIAVRREQPKVARPAEPKQKKAAQPSEAKVAAGGSGRTAVASLANYDGLVSAHLRRHQSAARSGGVAGAGAVTFSLSGSGSVTSVRIAKGTGAAALDQEILAMVRRASPFPAPPDGQPKSFTVPVNFSLQR